MRLLERSLWLCVLAGLGVYVADAQTSDHPRLMAQVASGEVIACAYSTDGRAALTGGREGKARLWNVATGAELQFFEGEAWIRHVAFSADNRRVLTVSALDEKTAVQLWDEATGKELGRISPPAGKLIFGAASPDGSMIATASWAKTDEQGNKLPAGAIAKIQMWNVETGKELRRFLVPGVTVGSKAVLSPDGSKLFTEDFDGPRLWDLQTGKLLWRFENHSEVVSAAVFSADGRSVVWGSIQGTVQLWNVETGKEIQHFSADYPRSFMGVVDSVALSPDGRRVLTASNEGRVRIWDVETGKELQRFAASGGVINVTVNCAAFSPDGRGVLTASDDKTARLWDVETGKEVRRLVGDADPVAALSFVADGRGIVTVSRTGMGWRLDAEGSRALPLQPPMAPPKGNVPPVAASTVGRTADLLPVAVGDGRYVLLVVLSPDGRRVLLAGFHGEQGVWDVETGKEIQSFEWQGTGFETADFSPDGSRMLTASGGLRASLWDVERGKEIQHFTVNPGWHPRFLYPEGDYRAGVERLALSPDGRRALTTDSEGSTRLWDVRTGRQVRVLKVHTFDFLSVGFSPDGSKMLTENVDGTATLRDVKTGKELQHFGKSSRPSFSADAGRVLMGLSVWDMATGKELRHFNAPFGTQPAETLSADGRRVLIGSSDGVTKLWDVETGRKLADLYGFRDGSWAVVDPEGRFDTDKLEGNVALHWIVDSDSMRVLPLAAFKDGHYTPHLLARICSGEKLPPVP